MKHVRYLHYRLANTLALMSVLASIAPGQTLSPSARSTFEGLTPKGLEPGSPVGSYAISGLDTVNPYSGSLNFSLPLLQVGGRGEAGYTLHLPIGIKWDVFGDIDPDPPPGCATPCLVYNFVPDWWGNLDYSYRPATIAARHTGEAPNPVCPTSGFGQYHYASTLTRITVRLADGTEIELRDAGTGGQVKSSSGLIDCTTFVNGGFNRGRTWVAGDGSATTFISNTDVRDYTPAPAGSSKPSGVLYLRDGTQYHFANGDLAMIRDRNGNKTTFASIAGPDPSVASFEIRDSIGRKTATAPDVGITVKKGYIWTDSAGNGTYDEITFPGNGANRAIKVYRRDYYADRVCQLTVPLPSGCGTKPTLYQLFGGVSPDQTQFVQAISKVELPDGRFYKFYYNDYAELARVVLPTGGAYEYDWENGVPGSTYPLIEQQAGSTRVAVYRRVKERREYPDGGASGTSGTWTRRTFYAISPQQNNTSYGDPAPGTNHYRCAIAWCSEVTVTDAGKGPNSSQEALSTVTHYYYGSPREGMFLAPYQYSAWAEGREFKTVVAHPGGGIQSKVQTWAQRATPSWWTGPNDGVPPQGPEPALDPRMSQQDKIAEDGFLARTAFSYAADSSNNPTDVDEYNFGATPGTVGSLLRRTHTDYQTDSLYNSVTPGGSPYINTGSHLRSLPIRRVVCATLPCDVSNFHAKTEYDYDTASIGSMLGRGTVQGHDGDGGAYGTSFTKRGNITETRVVRQVSPSVAWLTTKARYDILGNLIELRDAKGNSTTIGYTDSFGAGCSSTVSPPTFAFRTSATNAAGWTNSVCYDYNLGRPLKFTDPNNVLTAVTYESSGLDRISQIVRAFGASGSLPRKTDFSYVDTVGSLKVRTASSQLLQTDTNLKSEVQFDGFGRKTRAIISEDGTFGANANRSQTDTEYDGLGRTLKTWSPYRPGQSVLPTTWTYDGLGRVTQISHPEGSVAKTSYLGVTTRMEDEACKVRDLKQDSVGRIKQVLEDTVQCAGDSTAPAQLSTGYTYDVQDALSTVTQGAQTRTFTYDRAGRLLSAGNPESGTLNYSYDDNGNLLTLTDARTFVTTRTYDALDRPLSIIHPDGLGGTQTSRFCYDGLTATSSTCTGSTSVKGPLTSTWTALSTTSYTPDSLGRITASSQITDQSPAYNFSYSYNADDSLRTMTYPSGRVVAYDYDLAGRPLKAGLTSVGATDYVSSATYTPFGAIAALTLGNGVTETWGYNSRLQVQSMVAAKTGTLLDLGYTYTSTKNNGNVASQVINAGGQKTYTQTYQYDDLNRLTRIDEATTGTGAGAWWATFGFDEFGNRWVSGSSFPQVFAVPTAQGQFNAANNRLVKTYNNQNLPSDAYDATGNLTNHPHVGQMTYDGQNRLVRHVSGGTTVTLGYDAEGRRVKKDVSGVVTKFAYDAAGRLAAEYAATMPVDMCTRCFLTVDALGSTRLVTDGATGVVKQRRDYMPFGEQVDSAAAFGNRQLVLDGGVATYNATVGPRVLFTGKERDAETGLDFMEARYYSGAQGRFTSPDQPLVDQWETNPQSWNLYSYGRNNPLRFADPTGQKCVDTSNGPADDGTGGGCAAAGVDAQGNIQAQQVNVNAKGGNKLVAFAINAGFALSNRANDYFAWMFDQRPNVLQNTPTNREFTGQAATLTVGIATAVIGPGSEAAAAPRQIKVTWKGLLHVIQRHTGGMAGKSAFSDSAAVTGLVKAAEAVAPTPQAGGNFVRIVDAGRTIGTDVSTGQATSVYTVVTNKSGELVTAFPGRPMR